MTPLEWLVWWAPIDGLALEHRDPRAVVAPPELARDREPDDAGPDDDDVALAGRLGVKTMRDYASTWPSR